MAGVAPLSDQNMHCIKVGGGFRCVRKFHSNRYMTTQRRQVLQAQKSSLAEVSPQEGEPLFRPTQLADVAMTKAHYINSPSGATVVAVLSGRPRNGPFVRHRDEISAERTQEIVGRRAQQSQLYDVDLSALCFREHVVLGIMHEDDLNPGDSENDYIYLMKGLPSCSEMHKPSFTNRAGIRQLAEEYDDIRKDLDNAWHEQNYAKWTNDPCGKLRRSTEVWWPLFTECSCPIILPHSPVYTTSMAEISCLNAQFGWSVYIGGSEVQKAAQAGNKPFKLAAWRNPKGQAFYERHISDILVAGWKLMVEYFPKICNEMLAAVPEQFRLGGTGFTKVTVACNNPVSA